MPNRSSWEVPAFLTFGAFNDCPHPDEHVAFLKHWYDQYRVEVVAIDQDSLQVRVAFPPSAREAALTLAQAQLMYNRELDWNEESIEEMAARLMKARSWFFLLGLGGY
jgi:hypothetical protein